MNHLLPPILLDPVSCGADGLLGDAHDAAGVQAHLVEDEEEGAMGGLGSVFLLISSYSILLLTRRGDSFIEGLSLFHVVDAIHNSFSLYSCGLMPVSRLKNLVKVE